MRFTVVPATAGKYENHTPKLSAGQLRRPKWSCTRAFAEESARGRTAYTLEPKLFSDQKPSECTDLGKASAAILNSVPRLHTENLYFKFTVLPDSTLA